MSATDSFTAALAEVHARLDAWHSTVLGVVEEAGPDGDALADPRLEAAADAFHEALGAFEVQSLGVLGMVPDEGSRDPDESAWDTFSVELVVGVPDGGAREQLTGVVPAVEEAAEALAQRLEDEGFLVPEYRVQRGSADDLD